MRYDAGSTTLTVNLVTKLNINLATLNISIAVVGRIKSFTVNFKEKDAKTISGKMTVKLRLKIPANVVHQTC
jgi:hypothetical protein